MKPMLGNVLISHLAWAYGGFGSAARAAMNAPRGVFHTQKSAADLFEAFVGAVAQDQPDGFSRLMRWLRAIMISGALPSLADDARKHMEGEAGWRNIRSCRMQEEIGSRLGKRGRDEEEPRSEEGRAAVVRRRI